MSEKWIKKTKLEKAKAIAEEHWEWLEPYYHKIYVDAFIHGYKHGKEGK